MKSSPKCLYTIELTRGLAALVVLVLHVILYGHNKYGMDFKSLLPSTYYMSAGVDLFFIISGFLMVHTTWQDNQRKPLEFLLKRFIRVYPAYWLVVLCILPVYFFKPEWAFFGAAIKPSLWASFLLLPQQGPPILAVAWTLVYELYFYLLFAATLFLKPRLQLIVLGIFFAFSIGSGHIYTSANPIVQFFSAGFLGEFFAGMVLAHVWSHFPRNRLLPLACFIASAYFMAVHPFSGIARSMDLGLPAFMAFVGMLSIQKNLTPFPDRIAGFFGRISYALYLVHVPILAGLPKLAPYIGIHLPAPLLLALATILSIIASYLLHYHYEIQVQFYIKKLLRYNHIRIQSQPIETEACMKSSATG